MVKLMLSLLRWASFGKFRLLGVERGILLGELVTQPRDRVSAVGYTQPYPENKGGALSNLI